MKMSQALLGILIIVLAWIAATPVAGYLRKTGLTINP